DLVGNRISERNTTIYQILQRFTWDAVPLPYLGLGATAIEAETMSGWHNSADGLVSTGFGAPHEITLLFDDRTLAFPTPAAAAGNAMTGHQLHRILAAYRAAKRRAARRTLVLLMSALLPSLAVVLALRQLW